MIDTTAINSFGLILTECFGSRAFYDSTRRPWTTLINTVSIRSRSIQGIPRIMAIACNMPVSFPGRASERGGQSVVRGTSPVETLRSAQVACYGV
jgi:hypothetical protein